MVRPKREITWWFVFASGPSFQCKRAGVLKAIVWSVLWQQSPFGTVLGNSRGRRRQVFDLAQPSRQLAVFRPLSSQREIQTHCRRRGWNCCHGTRNFFTVVLGGKMGGYQQPCYRISGFWFLHLSQNDTFAKPLFMPFLSCLFTRRLRAVVQANHRPHVPVQWLADALKAPV